MYKRQAYSHVDTEILIQVTPKHVEVWDTSDGQYALSLIHIYITTIDIIKQTANSKLPPPYLIPAAVVNAHMVEEWELGIPPEPKIRSGLKERFNAISSSVLRTWAITHPATPLINRCV